MSVVKNGTSEKQFHSPIAFRAIHNEAPAVVRGDIQRNSRPQITLILLFVNSASVVPVKIGRWQEIEGTFVYTFRDRGYTHVTVDRFASSVPALLAVVEAMP